nr:hypothetical protein BgiMline_027246 [Biomphalaria glabrata]
MHHSVYQHQTACITQPINTRQHASLSLSTSDNMHHSVYQHLTTCITKYSKSNDILTFEKEQVIMLIPQPQHLSPETDEHHINLQLGVLGLKD